MLPPSVPPVKLDLPPQPPPPAPCVDATELFPPLSSFPFSLLFFFFLLIFSSSLSLELSSLLLSLPLLLSSLSSLLLLPLLPPLPSSLASRDRFSFLERFRVAVLLSVVSFPPSCCSAAPWELDANGGGGERLFDRCRSSLRPLLRFFSLSLCFCFFFSFLCFLCFLLFLSFFFFLALPLPPLPSSLSPSSSPPSSFRPIMICMVDPFIPEAANIAASPLRTLEGLFSAFRRSFSCASR
mmetsp:Transcript_46247/g.91401  ORF Transcript_46247/g.91401 Transcript_46247/m.91401 type:complete len:239 (-) Transcript_46247:315-1031(-)